MGSEEYLEIWKIGNFLRIFIFIFHISRYQRNCNFFATESSQNVSLKILGTPTVGHLLQSAISGYFSADPTFSTEIKMDVVAKVCQPEAVWTCLIQNQSTAIVCAEPQACARSMRSPPFSGGNMAHVLLALQTAGCFLGLVKAHRELGRRELRRLRLSKLAPGPGRGGHNSLGARHSYKTPSSEDVHATAW